MQKLSDADIKRLLKEGGENDIPITATTRPLLLRKVERLLALGSGESAGREEVEGETRAEEELSREGRAKEEPFEGYYGVAVSVEDASEGATPLSPFYTSKSEALKAVKNTPGARFKKFDSQQRAEEFSQQHAVGPASTNTTDGSGLLVREKANCYPGLKTQELTKFRKLVASGDLTAFMASVRSNPRHLITAGDAPQILQEGFRYNALHCAVRADRLELCRALFDVLQGEWFWEEVYPDDSMETREKRRHRLIDLYLNMQDKIKGETPLHFACKLGHVDIVAFLLSFPAIDTGVRNSYNETPADVTQMCPVFANKTKILELLREPQVFIPVLRAADNSTPPQLASPRTAPQIHQREESTHSGSPVFEQAFAGPMSPSEAKVFYREWHSPSKDHNHVKRSDPNKGLERVGRQLAHMKNVGWTEYWDFLNDYCDLAKPEGVQKLEDYLVSLEQLESDGYSSQRGESRDAVCQELFPSEGTQEGREQGSVEALAGTMSGLRVTTTEEAIFKSTGPEDGPMEEVDLMTPVCSNRLPPGGRFLTGSAPSRLDYDVQLAVGKVDSHQFPRVQQWLDLVGEFPETEQKSWWTPRSPAHHHSFTPTPSPLPISPLVLTSPPTPTPHSVTLTPNRLRNTHLKRTILTPRF